MAVDRARGAPERPGLVAMIEGILQRVLFASRWLLAPFYFALVLGLVALLAKVAQRTYDLGASFASFTEANIMLGVLAIVDLTLTASLIVIVIFSGYVNFVSRIDASEHKDWPQWMANIDFSELKLKLMSSIVAISAIKLLESFMEVEHESDRNLYFLVGIHLTFVVSTLLLALSDWLGHGTDAAAHGAAVKE
jgi:uncharacterized protein (TIGR00645 family)